MVFLHDEFLRKCRKYFAPVTTLLWPLSSKATCRCVLYGNEAGLSPLPVGMLWIFASRASRGLWRRKFSLPGFLVLFSLGSGSTLDRQHGAPSYTQFLTVPLRWLRSRVLGARHFPRNSFPQYPRDWFPASFTSVAPQQTLVSSELKPCYFHCQH